MPGGGLGGPRPRALAEAAVGGAGRAVLRGFAGFCGVSGIACRPLVERAFLHGAAWAAEQSFGFIPASEHSPCEAQGTSLSLPARLAGTQADRYPAAGKKPLRASG